MERADKLREIANQAELRGDWEHAEILRNCADWIVRLEAQNQTYRHIFKSGIIVQINNYKKRWFGKDDL
jgi:hypothetical protein